MTVDLEALYIDLHRHPELSFQETRTAGIAATHLRDLGLEVTEGVGITGVVGELRNGEGPTVWLRADMDALPVVEETGLAYASTATGVDPDGNTVGVMHACGHDMHVTAMIGAVERLVAEREQWSGTVVVVIQPAEEYGAGARAMLDDGAFRTSTAEAASPTARYSVTTSPVRTERSAARAMRRLRTASDMWSLKSTFSRIAFSR